MFWSVCRKVVCFAVILHRKKVFFRFAASPPNFSLILLKQRFYLCLAKLRCCRILLLRTTFSSSSVRKLYISFLSYQNCAFDLSSYPNHLFVWLQLTQKLRALCHKKQRFRFFWEKKRCFKFHSDGNRRFGQLTTKLGFFELYITKNSVFAFSLLEDVPLNFIAQKICFGLFRVKLRSFQRY